MKLREWLTSAGFSPVSESYYSLIQIWLSWYRGKVSSFHPYQIYNGERQVRMNRASLGMAKQGCEFWASLLWNEDCEITLDGEGDELNKELTAILSSNRFNDRFIRLIEVSFALGTGALVIYPKDGKPKIDFVPALKIWPLEWDDDEITSCAFATTYTEKGQRRLYLMIHIKNIEESGYTIFNRWFAIAKQGHLVELAAPEGVLQEYTTATKRFCIIKPNIVNNTEQADDENFPLGMSVFAGAIDTLQSIDLAFDGAKVSMRIGRPRIGVGIEALKIDLNGNEMPVFDPNDIAFNVIPPNSGADSDVLIKDLTTQYRASEFEGSLQNQLVIFSQQIGLGDRAFKWDRSSLATATQVISDNSSMLRTMEKHQSVLKVAVQEAVTAILDILGRSSAGEVKVKFDDSVTRDRNAERQRFYQYVKDGKFPFYKFLQEFEGYSEEEAKLLTGEALQDERDALDLFPEYEDVTS
jgi:A118 family predicted phage portal protein